MSSKRNRLIEDGSLVKILDAMVHSHSTYAADPIILYLRAGSYLESMPFVLATFLAAIMSLRFVDGD